MSVQAEANGEGDQGIFVGRVHGFQVVGPLDRIDHCGFLVGIELTCGDHSPAGRPGAASRAAVAPEIEVEAGARYALLDALPGRLQIALHIVTHRVVAVRCQAAQQAAHRNALRQLAAKIVEQRPKTPTPTAHRVVHIDQIVGRVVTHVCAGLI